MWRLATRAGCCALLLAGLAAAQTLGQRLPSANASPANLIPEGTKFLVRLGDKLDTSKSKSGKHFQAKLAEDLAAPGGDVIPRGRKIKGHVSSAERGFHARLLLSFDEIETQHGWVPLVATVTGVPGEHAVKQPNSEGEIERKGPGKGRMIESAAIGAGVGALGGVAAGGGHGAAIGAGVGGGAGLGAGLLTDRDLKLNKGQMLEVRLDRPLQVPLH
ncbi:MAG TPA: hypothetical protein VGR48_19175 [Terriglobales bacterium]|nr:hypothetical protein [Terriglobales bacterium]